MVRVDVESNANVSVVSRVGKRQANWLPLSLLTDRMLARLPTVQQHLLEECFMLRFMQRLVVQLMPLSLLLTAFASNGHTEEKLFVAEPFTQPKEFTGGI